jgi:hypothetical protein
MGNGSVRLLLQRRLEETSRLSMLAKDETTRQRLMAPRDKGPMRY